MRGIKLIRGRLRSWRKRKLKREAISRPDFFDHARTIKDNRAVDREGRLIPWMTYPAICYLKQIDFSTSSVFEYGAGSSTEFWSARARHVTSVEHDAQWARKVGALKLPNVELMRATGDEYVASCHRGAPHDVIVIDGRWRYGCSMACVHALRLHRRRTYERLAVGDIDFPDPRHRIEALKAFQPHHVAGMTDSIEANPQQEAVNKPGSF